MRDEDYFFLRDSVGSRVSRNVTGRSRSRNSRSRSRRRKKRKLNYKRVFVALCVIILFFYFVISGLVRLFSGTINPSAVASSSKPLGDVSVSMAVVGDIMCHSSNFADAYDEKSDSYDFSSVFTDIKHYLADADIAVGNLETTFAGKEIGYSGYPTFNSPEELAQDIKNLGIDVVSTANNHSLDKRYAGLVSTLDELDKVGLSHTGTYRSTDEQNKILTRDVNGIKFAFLSFTYGTNGIPVPSGKEYCINLIDKELIRNQISMAKALNPDVLCVSMHWGDEYKLVQNSNQEELADFLFENGVDIIFGSHPHVLEPLEKRTITLADGSTKDGFVIYSLGNFMSGQVIENTMNSIILRLKITKHSDGKISIDSYDYVPIFMYDKGAGQDNRYKILDIEKCISDYESGKGNISKELYDRLVTAKKMIDRVLAE